MKQQCIQDDSCDEAEASRLVQRLAVAEGLLDFRALVERTVEVQVIPRLVRARHTRPVAAQTAPAAPSIATLVTITLDGGAGLDDTLASLLSDGMALERILLDLVAPAASRLGEMWEDDTCSFSDVTLGTLRLSRAVQALGAAPGRYPNPAVGAPRVLLAQTPGEQHGLGLAILAQCFRGAGWNVQQESARSPADMASLVARQTFDLVGLSLCCDERLDQLAATIAAIRKSSRNPAIHVMVGGPPFLAQPILAELAGADATATDGAQAVRQANALLTRQACAA